MNQLLAAPQYTHRSFPFTWTSGSLLTPMFVRITLPKAVMDSYFDK